MAQTQPNLENGFKHYGSYDFHGIDTVNIMNGNLMLHAPLVPDYPQRGKLTPHYNLYVTSKNWQVRCVKAGDRLFVRQTTAGNVHVGIGLNFTNGTDSWGLTDQDGQGISNDGLGLNGTCHSRNIDLSPMQGKTASMVYLYVIPTGSGNWSGYFNDLSLVSANGTIYPLYYQQDTANFSLMDSSRAITGINCEVNRDAFAGSYSLSAHYYHGDQNGSACLDLFTVNVYVADSQSWNRYAYAKNSPLRFVDPAGFMPE